MKRLLIFIFLSFLIIPYSYAQGENYSDIVDRDELDEYLFQSLKEKLSKSEDEIYQAMGLLHLENRYLERAELYFRQAVSLNPKLYLSWYNLGLLHIDTEEGIKYFSKAIDADPDFPAAYFWLAYIYCRQRNNDEAIKTFEEYLKMAKGIPSESARSKSARKILAELYSGREGEELWRIRELN